MSTSTVVKMLTVSPYFWTTESPYFWFHGVGSPHTAHLGLPRIVFLSVDFIDYFQHDAFCVFQLLLKTIIQRIRKCLDDDIFMPLYPKQYVLYYFVNFRQCDD